MSESPYRKQQRSIEISLKLVTDFFFSLELATWICTLSQVFVKKINPPRNHNKRLSTH